MKKIIHTHRFVFLAAYLLGSMALFVFPGFEAKGYIFGSLVGIWPWMMLGEHLLDGQTGETIGLLSIPVVTAIEVLLCAWLMDRSKVPKTRTWACMALCVTIAAVVTYFRNIDGFDWWQYSTISTIKETVTISDFRRLYLIPKTIVFGMWGFYLATVAGVIYALSIMMSRRIHLTR